MLGHVSSVEVDRAIVEKFSDNERILARVDELYPDGLPEAAAWRGRAEGDGRRAAADMAVPDDPATPQREDAAARGAATREQQLANAEHAAANTAAPAPPRTVQRPAPGPAPRTRTR